jgi:hypothetical protein
MIRFVRGILVMVALGMIVGGFALGMTARAAPAPTAQYSSPDLLAKADQRARLAAEYRVRSREGRKDAIGWFTLANRLDQEAQRYRVAASRMGTQRAARAE